MKELLLLILGVDCLLLVFIITAGVEAALLWLFPSSYENVRRIDAAETTENEETTN